MTPFQSLVEHLALPQGLCTRAALGGRPEQALFVAKLPQHHIDQIALPGHVNVRCGLLAQEIPTSRTNSRKIFIPAILFRILPDPDLTILSHYFDCSSAEEMALFTNLVQYPTLTYCLFNEHNAAQRILVAQNTIKPFLENALWLIQREALCTPEQVQLARALLPTNFPSERALWDTLDLPILQDEETGFTTH